MTIFATSLCLSRLLINRRLMINSNIIAANAFVLEAVLIINLTVALLVLIRGIKESVYRSFFVFLLLVSAWVLIRFIDNWYSYVSPSVSIWSQLAILPPLFIPFFFFRFINSFTGQWGSVGLREKIMLLLPAIVMTGFIFTPYNVVSYDNNLFKPGSLYIWFSIYFVLLVTYSLVILWRQRYTMASWQRAQANNMFWGSLLTALFGIMFSSILPLLGFDKFYYIGSMSSAFFSILIFVTITKMVISKE